MNRRRNWSKIFLRLGVLLIIAAGAVSVMSYVAIHRTPDWYQPDTKTDEQRSKLANRLEDMLTSLVTWGQKKHYQPVSVATQQTQQQTQAMLAGRAEETFPISFTDDELNALFNKWANVKNRREWFEQFVDDPRLVIRDNQLIIVGKAKSMNMVVSLMFEPNLETDGRLNLKLARVLGGVMPLPDALWSGQRERLERVLMQKMPEYQKDANITSDGVANGDAASAAMNQLMLSTLKYEATSAVIFVPIDWLKLTKSLPVKITAVKMHDHTLEMTAEQMTPSERKAFLTQLKSSDAEVQ